MLPMLFGSGKRRPEKPMKTDKEDMVNRPPHYNQGGIECVLAIEASMTPEGFRAYLKGNIIKYLWRYEHKNGIEDLKKAQWYLARLRLHVERHGENNAGLPTNKT